MAPTIAIIGAGAMGSAVGQRLVEQGCTVLAVLEGRSAASRQRASDAGMQAASIEEALGAGYILSIVPPATAMSVAQTVAAAARQSPHKPTFVDANAVSPATVAQIAEVIAAAGLPFVDAGIIGPPVGAGSRTVFYAAGPAAPAFAELNEYGLLVEVLQAPIGAASALKMAFAGMTKGVTAICCAMMLAAHRAGAAASLHEELLASRPELLDWAQLQVPKMFPKAYRWVGEMQEIAEFSGDEATRQMYLGIAALYDRIAVDLKTDQSDQRSLLQFLKCG